MDSPTPRDDDPYRARAASGQVAYDDLVESMRILEPRPRALYVFDRRGYNDRAALPFWIGSLLLISAFAALAFLGPYAFGGLRGAATLTVWLGLGVVFIVRSRRRKSGREVPLLWLDSTEGVLRVRERPDQESIRESPPIVFEDVDELLFASRRILPPGSRSKVEGAGVFVRLLDGSVWPIVPSTQASEDAYRLALGIAARIGVGVKQVGEGWSARGE